MVSNERVDEVSAPANAQEKILNPLEPLIHLYQSVSQQCLAQGDVGVGPFPSGLEFQRIALAEALVTTAFSYLNSIFQVACSVFQKSSRNTEIMALRDKSLRLGPELVAIPWAQGLQAADRYIKHSDEWRLTGNIIPPSSQGLFEELTDLIGQIEKDEHQHTINQLLFLGLTEDELSQNDYPLAPKLVSLLKLDSVEAFKLHSEAWVKELYAYFKTHSALKSSQRPIRREGTTKPWVEVFAHSA